MTPVDPMPPRHVIVTQRDVPHAPALVYDAWTDPHHLARWWGPAGFTNTFDEFDARPGGRWRFTMHGPDGRGYPNECVFVELAPPDRIVFEHLTDHWFRIEADFAEVRGGTRVTFRMVFPSEAECARFRPIVTEANEQNLDRLEAELQCMQHAQGKDTP